MTNANARGFTLACPCCGAEDASITLALNLPADEELYCAECEEAFSLARVREMVGRWSKLLAWVETMPCEKE